DMVVVDFDTHDGQANGFESYSELLGYGCEDILEHCGLIVSSPSGGKHAYFRKDPSLKIPKNSKAFPAIDLLTKNCQVIGAGSNHVDGGEYVVEKWTGELTELTDEFFRWFRPKREASQSSPDFVEYEDDVWDRSSGESPRDSFDKSPDGVQVLKSAMEAQGYIFYDKGDHFSYTRPNKSDASFPTSGTLGRVNTKGNFYLKNFSTSDANFEAESYSLSEAYKILHNFSDHELLSSLENKGFLKHGKSFMETELVKKFLESVGKGKKQEKKATGQEIDEQYPTYSYEELDDLCGPERREYLIEGLLRRGEVMNLIAAPKVGKSWLVYNMALSVACGKKFLGYRASKPLNVLIVDNELHKEELNWRVKQVGRALGAKPEGRLNFSFLRGSNVDIDALDRKLDECGGNKYDIIFLDAFYRILPKGMSENDNAAMTNIYNKLDALASKNEASIVNIHHSSKGNQGDKGVTDVGAGAGSISRAADTHMVIREHSEDGLFVIDAVTRSGMGPKPITAKLNWPRWEVVGNVEPEVKTFENQREKIQSKAKQENEGKAEIVLEYIRRETEAGKTPNSMEIYGACKLSTWGNETTFKKHLKKMAEAGQIKELQKAAGSLALRYIFVK
ncbi:MAG: AAA family ATPase, partial [Pirellulales bacterium]